MFAAIATAVALGGGPVNYQLQFALQEGDPLGPKDTLARPMLTTAARQPCEFWVGQKLEKDETAGIWLQATVMPTGGQVAGVDIRFAMRQPGPAPGAFDNIVTYRTVPVEFGRPTTVRLAATAPDRQTWLTLTVSRVGIGWFLPPPLPAPVPPSPPVYPATRPSAN